MANGVVPSQEQLGLLALNKWRPVAQVEAQTMGLDLDAMSHQDQMRFIQRVMQQDADRRNTRPVR